MSNPTADGQITALREEIRRAGEGTRRVRLVAACVAFALPVALGTLLAFTMLMDSRPIRAASDVAALCMVLSTAVACSLAAVVALPAAVVRRSLHHRRLRRRLATLPRSERAVVLGPMRNEYLGDTRKIVGALCRDLGASAELTPATAPDYRGDEASPAESAP